MEKQEESTLEEHVQAGQELDLELDKEQLDAITGGAFMSNIGSFSRLMNRSLRRGDNDGALRSAQYSQEMIQRNVSRGRSFEVPTTWADRLTK